MNKKYITLIFLLSLFATPVLLEAQEVYDLNRCVVTALEQNYSLKVVRNREEIAGNNVTRGNAGYLPTLTTTDRYGGNITTTTQNMNNGSQNTSSGIFNSTGSAALSLNWTIFNGYNVTTTFQKLNELKKVGEINTQMSVENLIGQVVSEYYNYIEQLNYYKNLQYAVSLSKERARIDEERYLLGASSKLELLQSIVYLNADSSRLARQNESILESEVRLKRLMANENLEENITIQDSLININPDLVYNDLLNATLNNNTSIQIARKNQTISELDYKIIASRAYPYLYFSSGYTYSYRGYGSGSISDYGTLSINNQQSRAFNYGLNLSMDIFDGNNRRREKNNARMEIQNRAIQSQEVVLEIKAELLTVFNAYQNNLQLVQLEKQNLNVARENLGIALERYKLGSLSGLELREVQKSLLDAEERLISVQYQTKLAEISLLQISGNIMSYAQ